jgi:hypothetical protein
MIRGGLGQPAQQRSRLRRRRRRRRGVDRLTRRAGHPAHDGGGLAEGRIHAVRRTLLACTLACKCGIPALAQRSRRHDG